MNLDGMLRTSSLGLALGAMTLLSACGQVPPPVPVPLPAAVANAPSPCEPLAIAGFPRQDPPDPSTYFICKPGAFALNYKPRHLSPQWAVQSIKADTLDPAYGPPARTDKDDSRPDPDLPAARAAAPNDFHDTGYTRVFLASPHSYPFDDVKYSQAQYLSNAVTLHPDRVQAWEGLAQLALAAARQRGEVKVISGTIYEGGKGRGWVGVGKGSGKNAKGKIELPTHLFKVLVDASTGEYIAFVVPNSPLDPGAPAAMLVDWKRLEAMTGLVFAPDASAAFQAQQAVPPRPERWRP